MTRRAAGSVAYAVWGAAVVFVRHPSLRGLYMKTHPCVVHVACPRSKSEGCGAKIGQPCVGVNGQPKSETHYMRRRAYAKKVREESGA